MKSTGAVIAAPDIGATRVDSTSDAASVVASQTSIPNVAPLDLSSRVIRAAAGSAGGGNAARSFAGPENYQGNTAAEERLAKQMAAAKIPDCMSQDAFKFDPPKLGPFTLVGVRNGVDLRALWLAQAALAGHCK
jgi:hypothetical protein